jgi:hypothetical protein
LYATRAAETVTAAMRKALARMRMKMTMLPSSSFHLLPIRFDARYTTASSSIP